MDDTLTLQDRYSTAIRTSNLRSKPDTTRSASDVLGAAGLARKYNPLAMALTRLFCGDDREAREIVGILTNMLVGKAWHSRRISLDRLEAEDIARAVLAWHRDGVCRPCDGHGYQLIPGTPAVSDHECQHCKGSGKIRLERHFDQVQLPLAEWLMAEIEREQAVAGRAAMERIAPRLDL